jgi:hypothetical protein
MIISVRLSVGALGFKGSFVRFEMQQTRCNGLVRTLQIQALTDDQQGPEN